MSFDLNCFLHLLHCLKEPSFSKMSVSFERQKIQLGENFGNNPLLFIYELNVLKGAINTIKNNSFPPIIFECWNWKLKEKKKEVFNFLQDLGYSIKTMDSGNDHFAEYVTSR